MRQNLTCYIFCLRRFEKQESRIKISDCFPDDLLLKTYTSNSSTIISKPSNLYPPLSVIIHHDEFKVMDHFQVIFYTDILVGTVDALLF